MNNTSLPTICPKCGGPIPTEAVQGICPKCALAAACLPTEAGQPAGEHAPPPSLESVARAFPHLEILELIGTGGMGAVYKARQPKLDRLVALKLLTRPLAADVNFAERFTREARLLARLNHPGIVSVYDHGEAGGFFYLLMEFVDGVNLRQAMRAGRFTPAQALALVPKICEALQFAHDEGVLHRDIKPENLLLDTRGRVKIADFGIAKLIGEQPPAATLTASGLAVGTPHYMAPEQLEHPQDVDQRADIYSLGVVFYEMLTGELPIGRFAAPSQKTPVDPRVDEVVLRALEKERERRQRNVSEVKTQVEQITANSVNDASNGKPAGTGQLGATTVTAGTTEGSHSGPPAQVAPSSPMRASWLPVGSAACSIPAWLLGIGMIKNLYDSLGQDGLPPAGFSIGLGEFLVLGTGGFVGLAALFLGQAALREIRGSAGRIYGARLAVTGLLAIPALLLIKFLPPVLASVVRALGWRPVSGQGELFLGMVLMGIFALLAWAAWALRQWARVEDGTMRDSSKL